jgi:hypothetical protein
MPEVRVGIPSVIEAALLPDSSAGKGRPVDLHRRDDVRARGGALRAS